MARAHDFVDSRKVGGLPSLFPPLSFSRRGHRGGGGFYLKRWGAPWGGRVWGMCRHLPLPCRGGPPLYFLCHRPVGFLPLHRGRGATAFCRKGEFVARVFIFPSTVGPTALFRFHRGGPWRPPPHGPPLAGELGASVFNFPVPPVRAPVPSSCFRWGASGNGGDGGGGSL